MYTHKRMLVLLDGSERSRNTLRYLAAVKPFRQVNLVLFNVFSELPEFYWDLAIETDNLHAVSEVENWRSRKKDEIRAFMEDGRDLLVRSGFAPDMISIKIHRQQAGVTRDILEEVKNGYDAVIMRRRGMSSLQNVVLGSVSSKLLSRLSDIPVILAGNREQNDRVLVGVDGSSASVRAVEFMAEVMGGYGYGVNLFHVIRGGNLLDPLRFDYMPPELVDVLRKGIETHFAELREKLATSGFEAERILEHIVTGVSSRAEAIVAEAEAQDCSTIVVGRRGVSRVQEFFMGRVGNKVVQVGRDFTVWIV
ncbi:universal stress protein [Desulfosudis oleivorans]|uniref:UspA domain protein n=1 Tax=Desulfosudis oleivorans (strain DSM 6200 / JCM 39069 / Hxd3) TaxID=96561 RepID=A8ZYM9_DESOH|nr:universal stress protein [Desulfosudis oleivorans]ABW67134.1 UspA domain protein [Desulfosudis oleivorans Hxd3]